MRSAPTCIRAVHLHSTGRRATFDATPWFEQATDVELRVLRSMGFHAFFAESDSSSVELWIDRGDAEAWLRAHRPELLF